MRNIILLSAVILLFMTSCATYRNGQTPDDIYFAAEPDNYVQEEYQYDQREDVNRNNRSLQVISQRYCNDPTSMIILNNQCFCAVNGTLIPFIPRSIQPSSPVRQSPLSTLGNSNVSEPVRVGKYFITPKPSNGSSIFKSGSNQNQSRYYSGDNNHSGSRYFQNNSSPYPASGRSSGGMNSGRRQ